MDIVKFINLTPDKDLATELSAAYIRVLSSGQYIGGPEVEAFEREWAEYCEAQYCIGTSSGQAALELLLRAYGIGHNSQVAVPSWTAVATWKAVLNVGANPRPFELPSQDSFVAEFGMINELDLSFMVRPVEAIIPVHIYGYRASVGHWNTTVIQDACQAHGLKNLGTAAFSFYPTKNLGAYGDAGAIVTNEQRLYDKVKSIQGSNRLDPLQAAFLRVKLKRLDKYNEIRQTNAAIYNEFLTDAVIKPPMDGMFHQYVIRSEKRNWLRTELAERGIETMIHYPVPPHRQLGFDYKLPVADRLARTVLSLPIMVNEENVYKVVKAINELTPPT